jgi:hypothetical protein
MKSQSPAHRAEGKRAIGKPPKNSTGRPTALALAGSNVGRFKKGTEDLSASQEHLEGFGKARGVR